MIGTILELTLQDPKITFELALPHFLRVIRSGVNNEQSGPGDLAADPPNRRKKLFVNSPLESQVRQLPDQFDTVSDGYVTRAHSRSRGCWTVNLDDVSQSLRIMPTVNQSTQLATAVPWNRIIGIHPEDPLPG